MQIYGQSEFDVFARPVVSSDNASVFYDGYMAFADDLMEYKYMLVDGVAYSVNNSVSGSNTSQTVQCLPSNTMPPLASTVTAFNEATAISSLSISGASIDCPSGSLFKLAFSGADFALCASGSAGFTIYGSDLDIAVEYLVNPVEISAPTLTDATASCDAAASATFVTPTTLALLTGDAISSNNSRRLEAEAHMALAASSCSCKSTPRPCVFVHGLGQNHEEEELQDSLSYWGDLTDHAPCCSSLKYAVINTMDNAWTNATIQQQVCDHALSVSSSSNSPSGSIADTIIVTHSMGGLIVAGAIASGKCSLASSTSWVSLSAPMKGSMGSDYLQDVCNDEVSEVLQTVVDLVGQCPANAAIKSLAYQNETYSSSALNAAFSAAQEAYREHVAAAVCSSGYSGILSIYQSVYRLGGSVIPHKSKENDGMVEFLSCAGGFPSSKFGNSYADPFYVTTCNHADTSFLDGDALFDESQKPVKWFECLL
ncbi:hypothetical protein BBJ28_00007971 [Nothophytophthora sp. Chile5]|nr:hypothetical protein BBJ28_00007971 [Nothophytophthora sp. Chile5]